MDDRLSLLPGHRRKLAEILAECAPGAEAWAYGSRVNGRRQPVDSGSLSGSEAIEQLLGAQIALRNNRRLEAAMRSSRLPAVKRLADFDFTFQPSLRREQIDSLHELDFLRRKENVVFLGPPGVGKTHLAISLAIRAAERGRRGGAGGEGPAGRGRRGEHPAGGPAAAHVFGQLRTTDEA